MGRKKGSKHTEETKKKISEANKGKNNPNYGKHLTEDTKEKISKAKKGKPLSEEHKQKLSEVKKGKNIGKPLNEEAKNKLSESHKGQKPTKEAKKKMSEAKKGKKTGKDHPRARKVYCVELDMTFDTVTEASKYVGCRQGNLSSCLTGRYKTCGGYHWYYAEDKLKNGEAVYCVELDMVFDSIKEAGEYIGCSGGSISNALNGKQNTCGGYHWLRAEDVENKGVS